MATGAAVAQQYEDTRQEARDLALARNQYFQQVKCSDYLREGAAHSVIVWRQVCVCMLCLSTSKP